MVNADLNGVSEVVSALTKKNSCVAERLKRALTNAAGEVIAESTKITPIKTGELRSRTFIDSPKVSNNSTMDIAFGYEKNGQTFDNLYSVYVHERTELHHPVGQAKFLETAFKNFQGEMLQYLANEVRKCFK